MQLKPTIQNNPFYTIKLTGIKLGPGHKYFSEVNPTSIFSIEVPAIIDQPNKLEIIK